MSIRWELPLRTVSESNISEHWSKSSKRHKQQQFFVRTLFNHHEAKEIPIPCRVTLTRLSAKEMDEDNLPMTFKWIRDEIGACLFPDRVINYLSRKGSVIKNKGFTDSDPRVKWEYKQEKSSSIGIRIEIDAIETNE